MTDRLVAHFRAMARNNAWANAGLLGASIDAKAPQGLRQAIRTRRTPLP